MIRLDQRVGRLWERPPARSPPDAGDCQRGRRPDLASKAMPRDHAGSAGAIEDDSGLDRHRRVGPGVVRHLHPRPGRWVVRRQGHPPDRSPDDADARRLGLRQQHLIELAPRDLIAELAVREPLGARLPRAPPEGGCRWSDESRRRRRRPARREPGTTCGNWAGWTRPACSPRRRPFVKSTTAWPHAASNRPAAAARGPATNDHDVCCRRQHRFLGFRLSAPGSRLTRDPEQAAAASSVSLSLWERAGGEGVATVRSLGSRLSALARSQAGCAASSVSLSLWERAGVRASRSVSAACMCTRRHPS